MMLGSISHGTLRVSDLISTFLVTLEEMDNTRANEITAMFPEIMAVLDETNSLEDAMYDDQGMALHAHAMLDALSDALSEVAPEGTYFGAHWGDGADIGFWPIEDDE